MLNLFICGVGTVGGKLIEQIKNQYADLIGFETETAVVAHAHFRHLQYRDGYSPL